MLKDNLKTLRKNKGLSLKNIVIKETKVDTVLTKSNLPIAGYSINPYVGCPFGCKYCYATFMKRFTGHQEDWGMFLDVKMWDKIKNSEKYKGKTMIICCGQAFL